MTAESLHRQILQLCVSLGLSDQEIHFKMQEISGEYIGGQTFYRSLKLIRESHGMWTIKYTRIDIYRGLVTTTVRIDSRFRATLLYWWWTLCFTFNPFSVKRVSLYRQENGILFFESKKGIVNNSEELRRMRCKMRSKRWF